MRKSEKKILVISLSFFLLILFSLIFGISYYIYKRYFFIEKGKLIATINNKKIYYNDIIARLKYLSEINGKNAKLEDLNYDVLKAIIYEAYIDDIIYDKYNKKPFNKEKIDSFVLDYKKQLIKDEFLKINVIDKITEKDLIKKYNSLIELVDKKEERKISHILVNSEEEARRIKRMLLRGSNFEYLAKRYSTDKVSSINGGDLGYLLKEEIDLEEFASIAFMLKQDEISQPVKTSKGWHIIKVNDIRSTETKSFEDIKAIISDLVKAESIEEYINSIIRNKDIDFHIDTSKNKKTENNFDKLKEAEFINNNKIK